MTYQHSWLRSIADILMRGLLRVGLAPKSTYLLTVLGRKTGRPHSMPVNLIERGDDRWLVAPYGAVDWVRNARAAGWVWLSRGRESERVGVEELDAAESAPILKEYVENIPIVRPYFNAEPDAPVEVFEAEADRHPVFRILPSRS